jgi:hypothetical protein
VEGRQVGADARDGQPGQVLDHVHPVRPDITHGAQRAVALGLDAPVVVGLIEQPVLRVGTLHVQDLTEFARFDDAPDVLHHRVVTQVMTDRVGQLFLAASATIALASFEVIVSGFSHNTALPASSTAIDIG